MSVQSRRELLARVAPRYREARGAQKRTILNEFVEVTGYSRKYAIRLLNNPVQPKPQVRRVRRPKYGVEVQNALAICWAAANYICAKRLIPFLPSLIPSLERHGHLALTNPVRAELLTLSAATADRVLKRYRRGNQKGISTTKAGKLLKKQVPVRTFADWKEESPGFVEADLVAHCGTSPHGSFVCSLVLTDVATGWTECQALLCKGQDNVVVGLEKAIRYLPFDLVGLDTDNGSEFLNGAVIKFCESNQIKFTRGRAYKKNDQCFVEQKNGSVVRQVVGYDRFEGPRAQAQLNELYRALRHYVNVFQPSMKLCKKRWEPGGKEKRTYDQARTPLQRLLSKKVLSAELAGSLERMRDELDPVQLLRQLQCLQDALWRHAVHPNVEQEEAKPTIAFQPARCFDGQRLELLSEEQVMASRSRRNRRGRSRKPMAPRTWRTRKDPFETVQDELFGWFCERPELGPSLLLRRLQEKYPDHYPDHLLRTLQRRMRAWRQSTMIAVDDAGADPLTGALRLEAKRI